MVTLFERKQLRQLASYPYIDMFEDLETIIESRARSVDLKVNNYYDFLYSFHVTKENYRKAAHVMYECGMRLENELCNQEGLQRQAKAYLSCINCLKLVDPKNAWIVRPVLKPKQSHHPKIGVSPKRTHEGDEIEHQQLTERKMEVLELRDIDRDFQVWLPTQVCLLFVCEGSCSLLSLPSIPWSMSQTLDRIFEVIQPTTTCFQNIRVAWTWSGVSR